MWRINKRYLGAIIAAVICWMATECPCSSESSKSAPAPSSTRLPASSHVQSLAPRISFDRIRHNFGHVKEGIEVRHVFKVFNKGSAPLVIDNVITSCGCTVPTMDVKTIDAGGTANLEVVMNTLLKQGVVTKEIQVFSNDPLTPKASVFVTADVEDLHKQLTRAQRAKLFQGKCGLCHWKMGLALTGGDLFQADCGMCHGAKAQGGIGPALVPRDYSLPSVAKRVTQITSYGSKRHLSMPGFLVSAGGPLTDKEIESIVQYLAQASLKKKH